MIYLAIQDGEKEIHEYKIQDWKTLTVFLDVIKDVLTINKLYVSQNLNVFMKTIREW